MDDNSSHWRIGIPMEALAARGHNVSRSNLQQSLVPEGSEGGNIPPNCPPIRDIDLFVYNRPSTKVHLAEIRQLGQRFGIPIVSDIDDLYLIEHLPTDNPAYYCYHPKSLNEKQFLLYKSGDLDPETYHNDRLDCLHESFRLADRMTVTTTALARQYAEFNPEIDALPNSWDDTNPHWTSPKGNHGGVWIYFGGSLTHLGDLELLRGSLEPVLGEYPEAMLTVAGDSRLLDIFDIPGERKNFLGYNEFDTYPLLAKHADIMLAPLRDTTFNRCKSDIRLLEAGIIGAPWIASPLPQYKDWGVGGAYAVRSMEWMRSLRTFLDNPEGRANLVLDAREKVASRAITKTIPMWEDTYRDVMDKKVFGNPQSKWALWRSRDI